MTSIIEPTDRTEPLLATPSRPEAGTAPAPPVAVDHRIHIADPGPLGLAAFAGTTFVLSIFNAGLVDVKLEAVVLPLALLYGGLVQLLAGMWEFRKNNTFGAVAFSSYGAFWISFFVYVRYFASTLPPEQAHTATGIFLLMWTIFTAYMTLASVKTNGALAATFAAVLATFALLSIGEFAENATVLHAGGFVGLLAAACAWYTSAAGASRTRPGAAHSSQCSPHAKADCQKPSPSVALTYAGLVSCGATRSSSEHLSSTLLAIVHLIRGGIWLAPISSNRRSSRVVAAVWGTLWAL